MKKILVYIFLLLITNAHSEDTKKITLVAKVNNFGISNVDLLEEIQILKNLNTNLNNTDKQILEKIAIQSLIDDVLKRQEIDENSIKLSDSTFTKEYEQLIASIEKTDVIIDANIKKKIFQKVKLNNEWNQLINQKYRWNVNVNINEIEDRLKDTKNIPTDEKELQELKNKLINIEKNKKLEVFSKIHLSKIKKQSLIKFF
ncbi:MAG: hypothetical protein O3A26_06020 [Proteobacteria bacterium]|nr:hypothetical protein [Pseudomonadota bacterium]